MGTRAVISIDGKPMFATHWDGYPDSLGADLKGLKKKTLSSVFRVAKKHTIDSADISFQKKLNEQRLKNIAKRHKLSLEKVKKGYRRGNIMTVEDWEIGTMKDYGDFAEYEYDVDTKTGKIKVRELRGEWGKGSKGKWKQLSKVI